MRVGVEAGSVDHGELRLVAGQLFRVALAQEHVPREQLVPGRLRDHADRQLGFRVGARVAILDVQVLPLKVGREAGTEGLVTFFVDGLIRLSPPDLVRARGLAHHVLVVGRASRVLPRAHHEWPEVGEQSFVPLYGVLVERRRAEIPPDRIDVADAQAFQALLSAPQSLFHHRFLFPVRWRSATTLPDRWPGVETAVAWCNCSAINLSGGQPSVN